MKTNIEKLNDTLLSVRSDIKAANIPAKVRKFFTGSTAWIAVDVPKFEMTWSEQEQRKIKEIGVKHGLTRAMNTPIDLDRMTDPQDIHFEYRP